ncbi:50S ribosome-binding protein YggL [Paludibacterium yongneupense]|uniref:50S ribosome-binding protein YggL n=1 Tax=Paludibacterium yongneupense TaxID=400061 RepID=UPI000423C8F8|nr:50S ribosome-binding protein YggL [Paludibacterium yongneupense]
MRNPNSLQRLKKLNTRQRKKQRVGEFTELGFHLIATFASGIDAAAQDSLLDAWLTTVDAAGVSFGGHFDGAQRLEGVVFPIGAIKVDDTVKAQLSAWLQARAEIVSLEAGDLIDMWHYD